MKKITSDIKQRAIEIKEVARQYFLDPIGGMGLDNNDIHGHHNKLLVTGEYYFWLKMFDILTHNDIVDGIKFLVAHLTIDNKNMPIPGLYNRHPRERKKVYLDDIISWDEYNGVMFLANSIGSEESIREVIKYGLKNGWCFNNYTPFQRDPRYTRQLRDIAFYKVMAGLRPMIWSDIYMCISHLHSSIKETERTTGRMQIFYRLELMKKRAFLYKVVNDLFQIKLRRDYGNRAVSTMHDIYYPQHIEGHAHPIRQFAHLWDDVNDR